MEGFTPERIRRLVADWIREMLDEQEAFLAVHGHFFREKDEHGKDISPEIQAEAFSLIANEHAVELFECDYKPIRTDVDDLLISRGIPFTRNMIEYKMLCRELLKANVLFYKLVSQRATGNYNSEYEKQLDRDYPKRAHSIPTTGEAGHGAERLSKLIDEFMDSQVLKRNWTERTIDEYGSMFDTLVKILGDIRLRDITQERLREANTLLTRIPKSWTKKNKYKDKNINWMKKNEIPEKEKLSRKTRKTYTMLYNSFFKWVQAFKRGEPWLDKILTAGKASKLEIATQAVDIFTVEEMKSILLNISRLKPRAGIQPHHFWLPLMGMFEGARLEEMAQLHLADFKIVDGIKCITITETNDEEGKSIQRVKNSTSIRTIPLHPQLLELGLWELIEAMKEAGKTRLFEELSNDNRGRRYGKAFSQDFSRFIKRLGIESPTGRSKGFNSYRHTFITYCAEHGLNWELRERVTGHTTRQDGVSERNYIDREKAYLKRTYEEIITKIDYGIDLTYLKGHRFTKLYD